MRSIRQRNIDASSPWHGMDAACIRELARSCAHSSISHQFSSHTALFACLLADVCCMFGCLLPTEFVWHFSIDLLSFSFTLLVAYIRSFVFASTRASAFSLALFYAFLFAIPFDVFVLGFYLLFLFAEWSVRVCVYCSTLATLCVCVFVFVWMCIFFEIAEYSCEYDCANFLVFTIESSHQLIYINTVCLFEQFRIISKANGSKHTHTQTSTHSHIANANTRASRIYRKIHLNTLNWLYFLRWIILSSAWYIPKCGLDSIRLNGRRKMQFFRLFCNFTFFSSFQFCTHFVLFFIFFSGALHLLAGSRFFGIECFASLHWHVT